AASQREISAHAQAWSVDRAPGSLTAPEPQRKRWFLPIGWLARPRAVLTLATVGGTVVLVTMTAVSVRRTASGGKTPVDALAAESASYSAGKRSAGQAGGGGIVGGVVGGVSA